MTPSFFFAEDFLTISHDPRGFLLADWRGYVSVGQVRTGLQALLTTIETCQCGCLVNDNRQLYGTWTQAIRWINEDFFPPALALGLQKIAFIYSHQPSARYSVDRLLEVNDQYTAQTFEDYASAEAWMLDRRPTNQITTRAPEGDPYFIAVRDQDRHHLINVEEIGYIAAQGKHVLIYADGQTFCSPTNLSDIEKRVAGKGFRRIHRSYIINMHCVSHLTYHAGGSYWLFLRDLPHVKIPVSKSYAQALRQALGMPCV